jgi:hypothetical protein
MDYLQVVGDAGSFGGILQIDLALQERHILLVLLADRLRLRSLQDSRAFEPPSLIPSILLATPIMFRLILPPYSAW